MKPPEETSIGGRGHAFPSTPWSLVVQAQDPRSPAYLESINHLCQAYWKPVYASLRAMRRFSNEEAKDLTQDFFVELLEGGMLERFRNDRGSFRGYVKGALRRFLYDHHDAAVTLKRGGGRRILSFQERELAEIEPPAGATPEDEFDRRWAMSVVDHAVEDLRDESLRSGKEMPFRLFERYELEPTPGEPLTYARLAEEFGIKETDVSNHLFHCRSRLREIVLARIRDYVDDESEVQPELRRVFALLTSESQ